MNYSFIIRKAELEDAKAIEEVMKDSFGLYRSKLMPEIDLDVSGETMEDIERDIAEKEVFIAFIDDLPVGSIRIRIENGSSAMITRFGVKQQYHNIGIGKALMNLADKYLISKNISRAMLYTASKHSDLMRFYYARGFYVHSTSTDRGYIRALMIKDYPACDQ